MFGRYTFLITFLFSCCGYTTHSILPSNIKTIAIPIATNQTIKPGLAEALTEQLISDFTQDRTLKIDNINRANIILDCTIKNYERSPQSYTANQEIIAWKVALEADINVKNSTKSESLSLFKGNISSWITYPADSTEDYGTNKAIGKLSQEILRKVLTSW